MGHIKDLVWILVIWILSKITMKGVYKEVATLLCNILLLSINALVSRILKSSFVRVRKDLNRNDSVIVS